MTTQSPDQSLSQSPLQGRWHFGNGVLCCGTLRVATESFDTQPAQEFRDQLLQWICDTLNASLTQSPAPSKEMEERIREIEQKHTKCSGIYVTTHYKSAFKELASLAAELGKEREAERAGNMEMGRSLERIASHLGFVGTATELATAIENHIEQLRLMPDIQP